MAPLHGDEPWNQSSGCGGPVQGGGHGRHPIGAGINALTAARGKQPACRSSGRGTDRRRATTNRSGATGSTGSVSTGSAARTGSRPSRRSVVSEGRSRTVTASAAESERRTMDAPAREREGCSHPDDGGGEATEPARPNPGQVVGEVPRLSRPGAPRRPRTPAHRATPAHLGGVDRAHRVLSPVDSGSIEIPTTSAPWATSLRLNAEKISSSPRLVDPIHPATAIRIRRRV